MGVYYIAIGIAVCVCVCVNYGNEKENRSLNGCLVCLESKYMYDCTYLCMLGISVAKTNA